MEKLELAEKIIYFCIEYRLLDKAKDMILEKGRVEQELGNICFVENLIHLLIVKTKYIEVDNRKLKNLLVELEKIRLDLEYK